MLAKLKKDLRSHVDEEKKAFLPKFFKTGPGEYAHGDKFLGVVVPKTRQVAKTYRNLSWDDISTLMKSVYHEERLCALFVLVSRYEKGDETEKDKVYRFYLKNTKSINNWDLVDISAYKIVGAYLMDKDRTILVELARSKSLWEQRIAILSTFQFIRANQFDDTLKISKMLLNHEHDLIHKAVGWMLREVGKRDIKVEKEFLKSTYKKMPRTMLRYAIEKFPEKLRKAYLAGEV